MDTELLTNPYLLRVIGFTLFQAALSSCLSLGLALPLARALNYYDFRGKKIILQFMQFTWMLPSIAVVLGLVTIYGRHGWLSELCAFFGFPYSVSFFGLPAILLAHVFLNVPLATRFIFLELERIPSESWRLATQLSMRPLQAFRFIEWPQIKSVCYGVGCFIFLLCFKSFTLILALGGGPRYTTIEVAIYHAVKFDFDLTLAFILSLVQIGLCTIIAIMSFSFIQKTQSFSTIGVKTKFTRYFQTPFDYLFFAISTLLLLPPTLAIFMSGLNAAFVTQFTLPVFRASILNSLIIAVSSALLTTLLALTFSVWLRTLRGKNKFYATFIETLSLFNLIVPPTILSTLLFLLLRPVVDDVLWGLLAVIFINSIMSLPFALRALLHASEEVQLKYHQLCATIGFTRWQRWRIIEIPLLRKNIAHALAISAVLSLGDFAAIAFFGSPTLETLPFYIYNLLASYQTQEAAAAVLMLMLLCALLLVLIDKGIGGKNASR